MTPPSLDEILPMGAEVIAEKVGQGTGQGASSSASVTLVDAIQAQRPKRHSKPKPPNTPAAIRTTGRRKLHLGHFAFMRAVVEGIPVADVWNRYLRIEGEHRDVRAVASTIAWLRAEFSAAAQRYSRPGTARLMRLELDRLVDPAPNLPSLEQFAEEAGLEDYSQAEQIEAYEERYGKATPRINRRARLIKRQLDVLRWLEERTAQRPSPMDSVVAWLHPTLATRLEAVDIFTLEQLIQRVNGIGRNWSRSIPGIGPIKATRIVEWLRTHELPIKIGTHISRQRHQLAQGELDRVVTAATDVRPLEKFLLPQELNGSQGMYRRNQAQCLMAATNDLEAIWAWLSSKRSANSSPVSTAYPNSRSREGQLPFEAIEYGRPASNRSGQIDLSHTQRSYRKEAERFLLWAILERKKALSSMTTEDCIAYRHFIANPAPSTRWCGVRSRERWSPLWRPFEGALSPAAQRQTVTILKNLYGFLVDQNYLMGNPWSAVSPPRSALPSLNVGRSFTHAQWQFAVEQANAEGKHSTAKRLRLVLNLLYQTGMRLSEVVALRIGDLRRVDYPADVHDDQPATGWMLTVLGKGHKLREVPISQDVVDEMQDYLTSRGMGSAVKDQGIDSHQLEGVFILGHASDMDVRAPALAKPRLGQAATTQATHPSTGIAATTLYRQLKGFFAKCADELTSRGDIKGAKRFRMASTHWLRHTHATHALASGVPIQIEQQNLGHVSLATTTAYITTEQKSRLKAMQGFWSGKGGTARKKT